MEELKNLYYRRQFIAGKNIKGFKGWQRVEVAEDMFLAIHPDLEVTQYKNEYFSLILLGYIINPYNVKETNMDNLMEIANNAISFSDIQRNTYSLSGRWILIYKDNHGIKAFNDPCSMRQIYYSVDEGNNVYIGSQPNILAKELGFSKDDSPQLTEYINSKYFINEENPWIGDRTIYEEIKHLLPNHYLDFKTGLVERYWLDFEGKIDIEETVQKAGEILKGSLLAINERYTPMLAVTAGWDSRVLLAASKEIQKDIYYFVSTMNIFDRNYMDIKVPDKLLTTLGLNLNIIDNLSSLRDEFIKILKENVTLARELPKTLTIQHHLDHSEGRININGNASEIARSYYGNNHPDTDDIDATYLCKLLGCPTPYKYMVAVLDDWLIGAREFSKDTGIKLTDLFYWEQKMGNWGAMYQAEQDIAVDEFSPYNNRQLLMILLKVDEKYRVHPNYELYKKIINSLWLETLSEPINPLGLKTRTKRAIVRMLPASLKINIKSTINSIKNRNLTSAK